MSEIKKYNLVIEINGVDLNAIEILETTVTVDLETNIKTVDWEYLKDSYVRTGFSEELYEDIVSMVTMAIKPRAAEKLPEFEFTVALEDIEYSCEFWAIQ